MSGRSTVFCRLLLRSRSLSATPRHSTHPFVLSPPPSSPTFASQITRNYSSRNFSPALRGRISDRAYDEIAAQADIDRRKVREEKIKAGIEVPEVDEDYVDPRPIVERLERMNAKYNARRLSRFEDDSDSEPEDEDSIKMRNNTFQRQFDQFEKILDKFAKADSFDDALKWMKRIDEFEEKHFKLKAEYRVIGELMNKLKVAEGKEKFLLQVKLNRALKLAEARDAFDPNDPANYGVIQRRDDKSYTDKRDEDPDMDKDKETKEGDRLIDMEFDDMKQKDNKFLEKINAIDKKLEEKLAELDYTFGRKGKQLEEDIKGLAEERNSLIEKKREPLYRKGFDVRVVDMNRTSKVTKGGRVAKYTAMMACGNYNGVIGFAKGKAHKIPLAIQKAREKCFQNLHYVERHEGHTIAHAIQTKYKGTKLYLWPAPTQSGMKAGRTVEIILKLAGYKNVKSKVIGSRNPHNTVKATFMALNAIETPKDVEEKFGRTVVESHLL